MRKRNEGQETRGFYSTRELANYLGFQPQTLANWRSQGHGPRFVKMSPRRVRYAIEDVQVWLHGLGDSGETA